MLIIIMCSGYLCIFIWSAHAPQQQQQQQKVNRPFRNERSAELPANCLRKNIQQLLGHEGEVREKTSKNYFQ